MPLITIPAYRAPRVLPLPDSWTLHRSAVRPVPALPASQVEKALARALEATGLHCGLRGKRIMVVVEDVMRPAPTAPVIGSLVEQLLLGGAEADRIRFMLASAVHRAPVLDDYVAKLGTEIVERYEVLPHSPYENLHYAGTTERDIPVWVNRWVAESDLRIAVGGVLPHAGAGFGGGAKLIAPGVCGIETIAAHHGSVPRGGHTVDGNPWRNELEEIARRIGLDCSVNLVLNGACEISALFAGEMVAAHRAAVAAATELYRFQLPHPMDVAVVGGYPLDREIGQARKAIHTAAGCVRPGGTIVLVADCPEGAGFHALYGIGGRFTEGAREAVERHLGQRQVWIYSETISRHDIAHFFPASTRLFRDPELLARELSARHPQAEACLLEQGALLLHHPAP